MPAPVLLDAAADQHLVEHGFATVPFLSTEEAQELRARYRQLAGGDGAGMSVDYTRDDRGLIAAVAQLLEPVWERHLGRVFVDHRPVFATFVVKFPGPDSSMFLHDDRTFVDERRHRAATLWIPLVDTSPENGCLHVVPGSHRLAVTMAGTATPELYRPYEHVLEPALVPVPMRAGEALVYDTRVLHASPANRSGEPREAIVCAVAPREADLVHVVGVSRRGRRLHRVDEQFFVDHSPQELERGMPERYPVVDELEDDVLELDPALVADVSGGPAEARTLVPPDLVGAVAGGPERPVSERPVRVGSLVTVDVPPWPRRAHPAGAGPSPAGGRATWVPALLTPDLDARWVVGDPQARVEDGGRLRLRLAPGQRLCLPGAATGSIEVLEAGPATAGVVAAGAATTVSPGEVVTRPGADHVLWNHGPADLEVVVHLPDAARSGRRSWRPHQWRRDRARRRLTEELVRAVAPDADGEVTSGPTTS